MAKVKFTANANWQGRGYKPGQEVEMDDATAAAYAKVDQVEILDAKPKADKPKADKPKAKPTEPAEE